MAPNQTLLNASRITLTASKQPLWQLAVGFT